MNKTYVCADLHGMYDLWVQIRDFLDPTDTLYVLGDATDRGPNGWKLLKELLANRQVKYIKGNHDQMMIESWKDDFRDTYLWFRNGGYVTYSQMDLDNERTINLYLTELNQKPYRDTYINKLGQTIYLSHAGFTPGVRETDDLHQFIWDRDHIYDDWQKNYNNIYVVHGHTGSKSLSKILLNIEDKEFKYHLPTILRYANGHKIDIDLTAFVTNRTCILDLDSLNPIYFTTKGE